MQISDTEPDLSDRAIRGLSPRVQAETISFGRFRILPACRLLVCAGREISIGGRAFDLLLVLLRAQGQLVDKNEIARRVWPSTIVDESNIRFQIGTLRKALGPEGDRIKSIPGRGYLLADPEPDLESQQPNPSRSPIHQSMRLPDWLKLGFASPGEVMPTTDYVAVIDDDATVLGALAGLIRSAGFLVETFLSISAFLLSTQSRPPGCIVLDAWMPGQGGLDFQAELNGAGVPLPIVFISGYADVPMSVRAIKAGAYDFLTKPVRHDDLLKAICLAMASTTMA